MCVAHGGGRRCTHPGCAASACGTTGYCTQHGGTCEVVGCNRSARGATGRCYAHGNPTGGRRCTSEGCGNRAMGASGKCIAHGGGRRCQVRHPFRVAVLRL